MESKLQQIHLRLDLRNRKATALSLGDVLDLGAADAELHGRIAILLLGPVGNHLATVELQDRDRNMFARIREDAGHADLLCDDT